MLKLGYFVPHFPKLSETFILREYLMLRELGAELVPAALRPAVEAQVQPGAEQIERECFYLHHRPRSRQWLNQVAAKLRNRSAYGKIPAAIRGEACDLAAYWRQAQVRHIHIHFCYAMTDIPLMAAQLLGVNCSLSLHAQDLYLSPDADLQRRLRQTSFAVTCTEFNRNEIIRRCPDLAPGRIRHLYHGVEEMRGSGHQAPGGAPPTFLAVGRLVENKGFDLLLRALARQPSFRAVIIGEGQCREEWEALAGAVGVAGRVDFLGALPTTAVQDWLAKVVALVAPCRVLANGDSDGIPNVILEALAAGTPVITTGIRSLKEIMRHGENGLVVPAEDDAALAAAMAGIAADEALRTRLTAGGRETVRQSFDLRRNVGQLLAWCQESGNSAGPGAQA